MVAAVNEPKYWCGMCQEEVVDAEDAALSGCKHVFHRECIMQYASCDPEKGKGDMSVCRVALTIDLQPSDLSGANKPPRNAAAAQEGRAALVTILSRLDLSQYTSSSVDALLKGLNDMRSGKMAI